MSSGICKHKNARAYEGRNVPQHVIRRFPAYDIEIVLVGIHDPTIGIFHDQRDVRHRFHQVHQELHLRACILHELATHLVYAFAGNRLFGVSCAMLHGKIIHFPSVQGNRNCVSLFLQHERYVHIFAWIVQ